MVNPFGFTAPGPPRNFGKRVKFTGFGASASGLGLARPHLQPNTKTSRKFNPKRSSHQKLNFFQMAHLLKITYIFLNQSGKNHHLNLKAHHLQLHVFFICKNSLMIISGGKCSSLICPRSCWQLLPSASS